MSRRGPFLAYLLALLGGCGSLPHSRITPASDYAEILMVGMPPSAVVTVDGNPEQCQQLHEGCLFRFNATKLRHIVVREGDAHLFEQDQFVALGSRKVILLSIHGGNRE